MKVSDLKRLCDRCTDPENTVVLVPASDHHYSHRLDAELDKAVFDKRYGYSEHYDEVELERGESLVNALIIR